MPNIYQNNNVTLTLDGQIISGDTHDSIFKTVDSSMLKVEHITKFDLKDVPIPYITYEILIQAVNCTTEFVIVSKDKDDKLESYRIDVKDIPNMGIKNEKVFALIDELAQNTDLIYQDESNHQIIYVGYLKCELLGILRYPLSYLLRIIE